LTEEVQNLILKLKEYDSSDFDGKDYEFVRRIADNTINSLMVNGEIILDYIYPLLECPETWTCLFGIEILGKIKSEKSVKILIDFIIQYEDTDYYDRCDEAMFALINIGKPAAKEIIITLDNLSRKNKYSGYLDEALSKIDDKEGRLFRSNILKDYIKNDKKYHGWFNLTLFIVGFNSDEKEVLPLLKQLLKMDITKKEEHEILSAIEEIEDPEKYKKTLKKDAELLKPLFRQLIGTKKRDEISIFDKFKDIFSGNYKITDKEMAEFLDRASEPDENFEANFICNSCNKRQNIKTGLIWSIKKEKEDMYSFGNEIMCKYCRSHDIKLTKSGMVEITKKQIQIFLGNDKGVMPVGKKIFVEDREIAYDKTYEYMYPFS